MCRLVAKDQISLKQSFTLTHAALGRLSTVLSPEGVAFLALLKHILKNDEQLQGGKEKFSVAVKGCVLLMYKCKQREENGKSSRWLEYFEVHRPRWAQA